MIAKGNLHGDGAKLASYLTTGGRGEIAELALLARLRGGRADGGIPARTIPGARHQGGGGIFSLHIRLAPGEKLTRRQWIEVIGARAEQTLGFTGQPCAISFHIDRTTGERHLHLAWSRIARREDGRLFALDPGLYKLKLKDLSRALEKELGLKIVSSDRQPGDRARRRTRRV